MYKVKKEYLERPLVDCNDLLNAICDAVEPALESKKGVDCVLRVKKKSIPPVVYEDLTDADLEWLKQGLKKLPRLHGKINEEELKQFWAAYMQLENRPDWYLILQPKEKFTDCEGITCCYQKLVTKEPFDLAHVISEAERADLSKLLGELPQLHGRMTAEETENFLRAYRNHSNRLTWEPGLIGTSDRSINGEERSRLKKEHARQLTKAIQNGDIVALTKNHVPCNFLGLGTYFPQDEVKKYLRQIGLYHILESKEAALHETAIDTQEALSNPAIFNQTVSQEKSNANQKEPSDSAVANKGRYGPRSKNGITSRPNQKAGLDSIPKYEQMADVIDTSPRGDEMRDLLARALREVADHDWRPLFDWFIEEARRVNAAGVIDSILTGIVELKTPRSVQWKDVGKVQDFTPKILRQRLERLEKHIQVRLTKSSADPGIQ